MDERSGSEGTPSKDLSGPHYSNKMVGIVVLFRLKWITRRQMKRSLAKGDEAVLSLAFSEKASIVSKMNS